MNRNIVFVLCIIFCLYVHAVSAPGQSAVHYGQATVSDVLRIDEQCTLYCNIEGFPAIIGENMPVKINGFKPANNGELNKKIKQFLCRLFLSKNNDSKVIHLKNIQRGDAFCLRADVEIDGSDLCDLLVEDGLAKRVIEIKGTQSNIKQNSAPTRQTSQKKMFVASKTSKVFHRTTCSHTARMDLTKAAYFSTRKEAEKTGRRPCKTCNP